jgi:hypothetical protein
VSKRDRDNADLFEPHILAEFGIGPDDGSAGDTGVSATSTV